MSNCHPLWTSLLLHVHSRKYDACKDLLSKLKNVQPDLYCGKLNCSLNKEEITKIADTLIEKTPKYNVLHKLRFFATGIDLGRQQLGWDVPVPDMPVVVTRERNRFTPENFHLLRDYRKLESAYLEVLKNTLSLDPDVRLGQLMLSAIMFGGLCTMRWLDPWLKALPHARSFKDLLWLDMDLVIQKNIKNSWTIKRRWLADPLSLALIIRWHQDISDGLLTSEIQLSAKAILTKALNQLDPNKSLTTHEFMRGAKTSLGLKVKPFLASYASEDVKCVSLPSTSWARLLTDQSLPSIPASHPEEENIAILEGLNISDEKVSPRDQKVLLNSFWKDVFSNNQTDKLTQSATRNKLTEFCLKNAHQLSPLLQILFAWGNDLLTHYNQKDLPRGRVKSTLQVNTVKTYLNVISEKLIAVAGDELWPNLDSDELHDIYGEVIDICSSHSAKNTCGRTLYRFHQFLRERCSTTSVDFSDLIPDGGPKELGVNANLITPTEFTRVQSLLSPNFQQAERLEKIQSLTLTLAFRVGLRRSEIRKLRIIDLQGNDEPYLLIRRNRFANNKSTESNRSIPLRAVLTSSELQILQTWKNFRINEAHAESKDDLLFCLRAQPLSRIPEYLIFDPISKALRQVTGDETLRFHNLRHSFVNWNLIRLLQTDHDQYLEAETFMNSSDFSAELRQNLRQRILGHQGTNRRALFAVASLSGHTSPQTTLWHYFHLADWLLYRDLIKEENEPVLNALAISKITGLSLNQIYYHAHKNGVSEWRISCFGSKKPHPPLSGIDESMTDPDMTPLPKTVFKNDLSLDWNCIHAVLRDAYLNDFSGRQLAERHSIDEGRIASWLSRETFLKNMTFNGNLRHVPHSQRTNLQSQAFPVRPRVRQEKEVMTRIQNKVLKQSSLEATREQADYFIRNYSTGSKGVAFSSSNCLERYLQFLTAVGIEKHEIYAHLSNTSSDRQVQDRIIELLTNIYALPDKNIDAAPGQGHSLAWIQVFIGGRPKTSQRLGSSGFRYSMYMLSIGLGMPQET